MPKIIQDQDVQTLIQYLSTKPYAEVAGGIQMLSQLPNETTENSLPIDSQAEER